MLGFTDQHRKTFRVRLEQGGLRADPYAFIIPGQFGDALRHKTHRRVAGVDGSGRTDCSHAAQKKKTAARN